ncbi:MAG: MFS transporter [Clostridiales bacterium]|nr:MFS transporter [Clostridiales bacterium]
MDHKKIQLRLNILDFLIVGGLTGGSYLAVVLRSTGMSSMMLGTVLSINSLMALLTPPLFGVIADKIGSPRKTMYVTLTLTCLVWLGIPLTMPIKIATFPLVVVFVVAGAWVRSPVGSLTDSYLMQVQTANPKVQYSAARKWGSLGYSIIALLSTPLMAAFGVGAMFYIPILILAPVILLTRKLGDYSSTATGEKRGKLQLGRVFKNYYLVSHILCLMVVWIPFMLHGTLVPYLLSEIHADPSLQGIAFGIRAFMEFPSFMLVPFLMKKFDPQKLIPLCFFYYVIECLVLAATTSVWSLYAIMVVSGTVFAWIIGININYVHSLAPAGLKSTVVTVNAAAQSLAGVLGNLLAGALVDAIGIRATYLTVAALVTAAVVLMYTLPQLGRKKGIPLQSN